MTASRLRPNVKQSENSDREGDEGGLKRQHLGCVQSAVNVIDTPSSRLVINVVP